MALRILIPNSYDFPVKGSFKIWIWFYETDLIQASFFFLSIKKQQRIQMVNWAKWRAVCYNEEKVKRDEMEIEAGGELEN